MSVLLEGRRCVRCDGTTPSPNARRCVRCGSAMVEAALPDAGTVWSSTVVHGGPSPVGLSYVDLLDGPRVLVRFDPGPGSPQPGNPVVIEMRDGLPYLRAGGLA